MTRIICALLALLLSACATTSPRTAATPPPSRPAASAPAQESLLDLIPGDAVAAVVLRSGAFADLQALLDRDPEMRAELSGYLTRTLGFDATRIEGAVGFLSVLTPEPSGAVILRISGVRALKWPKAGSFAGVDLARLNDHLVAAVLPSGVTIGTQSGVQAAIAVAQGQQPALGPTSTLAFLDDPSLNGDTVLVGTDLKKFFSPDEDSDALEFVSRYGLEKAMLGYEANGRIVAAVQGDPAKLPLAKQALMGALSSALTQLDGMRPKANEQDDPTDVERIGQRLAGILGYHALKRFTAEIEPQLAGDRLVSRYQLPQMVGSTYAMISIAGTIAELAIRSFEGDLARGAETEGLLDGLKATNAPASARAVDVFGPPDAGDFEVVLSTQGPLLVNGAPVMSDRVLLRRASDALAADPNLIAAITVDGAVPHRQVLRTVDVLQQAGIQKIALNLAP